MVILTINILKALLLYSVNDDFIIFTSTVDNQLVEAECDYSLFYLASI